MAIYRITYQMEGVFVTVADSPEEATRAFRALHETELGALGQLTEVDPPQRDLKAEARDEAKLKAIFREASLG